MVEMRGEITSVSIRPGVSLLTVLPHLNYKHWFALGEFVDNAIESYRASLEALRAVEGPSFTLAIDIDIDAERGEIVILDNAAGIGHASYVRAFRPAEAPADASGLSEFGMGMKSAAAWLAPRWKIRTSALGEAVERTVAFDIAAIVAESAEELSVSTRPSAPVAHFTEIVLYNVRKLPRSRTLAKIKEHLASLYRRFIEAGEITITLNGEPLRYSQPDILVTPYWRDRDGAEREWRVPVNFMLEGGRRVEGWAALRAKGSTSRAGFALLRRGRVIEGSGDTTYRPREIFGASNSFTHQRLFGELDLTGFGVSHTKDGIRWDEVEEELIAKLKNVLSTPAMPLLDQAQNWRSGEPGQGRSQPAPPSPPSTTGPQTAQALLPTLTRPKAHVLPAAIKVAASTSRRTRLELAGENWDVELSLDHGGEATNWLDVEEVGTGEGGRLLRVRVAMLHPFSASVMGRAGSLNEGVTRLATGLAIAEMIARNDGVRYPSRIRTSLNELLLIGV